jgi:hypothetical protein
MLPAARTPMQGCRNTGSIIFLNIDTVHQKFIRVIARYDARMSNNDACSRREHGKILWKDQIVSHPEVPFIIGKDLLPVYYQEVTSRIFFYSCHSLSLFYYSMGSSMYRRP